MRYAERVVVVTGGSRGIGEGIVRAFVREGAHVVAISNDREGGERLAAAIGSRCAHAFADVRRETDLTAVIDGVMGTHGRIDCLVNNAGTHLAHRPIDEITTEAFRGLLDLNLVSQFMACRLVPIAFTKALAIDEATYTTGVDHVISGGAELGYGRKAHT